MHRNKLTHSNKHVPNIYYFSALLFLFDQTPTENIKPHNVFIYFSLFPEIHFNPLIIYLILNNNTPPPCTHGPSAGWYN